LINAANRRLTGKSLIQSVIRLSSPVCKNIPVFDLPKSLLQIPPSRSGQRGVAHVTNVGRDAVDADARQDEQR
jgi:hypothetical protein